MTDIAKPQKNPKTANEPKINLSFQFKHNGKPIISAKRFNNVFGATAAMAEYVRIMAENGFGFVEVSLIEIKD